MNTDCLELKGNGCNLDYFEKNAYFHGKLMTARDMLAEQKMHEAKLYATNRFVLGDGLVCGLETDNLRVENGKLMVDIKPGMGIDCCGRLVVVKGTGAVSKEVKQIEGETGTGYPEPMYLYVRYKECLMEAVPIPGAGDACEEKCCYNRILEVFDVIYSANHPALSMPPDVDFPSKSEYESDNKGALLKIAQDYYNQNLKSGCSECPEPMIFLGAFNKLGGEDKWKLDETETGNYLKVAHTNKMLYDIITRHVNNFDNPHEVTAAQSGALVSVDGVSNEGGNVDLIPDGAIEITPDNDNNSITIGENHSAKTDNPHQVTAEQIGSPISLKNVQNPGGNIDLASSDNTISIKTGINNIDLTLAKVLQDKISYFEDQIKSMQRYLMDKSLKYKLKAFSQIKERYGSTVAEKIIELVKEALDRKVYTDPEEYLAVLKELLELELAISEEIKDKVTEDSLKKYVLSVEALGKAMETENVSLVAVAQDEVCEMAEWLESAVEMVVVPDVIKQNIDLAKKNIVNAGLIVGKIDEIPSELEPGTVIDQKPVGGTEVPLGSAVDLRVAAAGTATVPDVVKMNIDEAVMAITKAGLAVGEIVEKYSDTDDLPPGTVRIQNPAAGNVVPIGSPVNLEIAAEMTVKVPDLLNMNIERAKMTLEEAGLMLGTISKELSDMEPDTVIKQNPEPGTETPAKTPVDLVVSTNVTVRVPDVTGLKIDDAKATIENRGLILGKETLTVSKTKEIGTVSTQSPTAGVDKAEGSSVDIRVVTEGVNTPNVVGEKIEDAKVSIDNAGLVVGKVESVISESKPGTVTYQSPSDKHIVAAGSSVNLNVAAEPMVAVTMAARERIVTAAKPEEISIIPNVVDKTIEDAKMTIEKAGLVVDNVTEVISDLEPGTVIEQFPPRDLDVTAGSKVDLLVTIREETAVPDLVGLNLDAAKKQLEEAGLLMETWYRVPSSEPPNMVLKQEPVSGTQVNTGSAVRLWVSAIL